MNTKFKTIILVWLAITSICSAEPNYEDILRNTCRFYDSIRTEHGFYLDTYIFSKRSRKYNFTVSSACTGIGLISLCIAHQAGFDNAAKEKILTTLRSLNAETAVAPTRNTNGLFEHFFDARTGEKVRYTDFSSIDTALLMSGAIFCKNTFKDNAEISRAVDKLWNSINWSTCKIDETHYYLGQDQNGKCRGETHLFNEYIILADYCALAEDSKPPQITTKWTRHKINGFNVLSDLRYRPLPLFAFQFPLYMSPVRSNSKQFYKECFIAAEADKDWWLKQTQTEGIWGTSAGAGFKRYQVNRTGDNEDLILHAPAMAGFMCLKHQYIDDFQLLLKTHPELMQGNDEWKIPWRISLKDKNWRPRSIQGIDVAPLLFGLASRNRKIGFRFFQEKSQYNP